MATFLLKDLRGGEADEHPATIGDNQVSVAQDIDYWRNTLGGRRNGSVLTVSGLAYNLNALLLHDPTEIGDGTLWALDENAGWKYYDTDYVPTTVVPSPNDIFDPLKPVDGATLHRKLFIAARTTTSGLSLSGLYLNRLHVWDGTVLRRTGLAAPVGAFAPSDSGTGGVSGERVYRMRYTAQDADGLTLRRSEPSAETTFDPSGSGDAVVLTRLALIGEGETHWEVEISGDGGANFYRVATVPVATTTYNDTIDLAQNVATSLDVDGEPVVLSADIGDYALQGAYKWVIADRDRIIGAGNYADETAAADVAWSVVGSDTTGVGNDERVPVDTGNRLALDGEESGGLTGLKAHAGRIFGFKRNRVYSLTNTGNREAAYLPQIVSTTYGAMEESIVEGTDAQGQAALYFVDPELGPMSLSTRGFSVIAPHLRDKFQSEVNFDAAYRVVNAVYHPGKGQVWWHFAGLRRFARGCCPPPPITPDWPTFRWVYDVRTGGSTFHSLPRVARSTIFWQSKPMVTAEGGALVRCDEDGAPDDYSHTFRAYLVTKAYELRDMTGRFVVRSGIIEGRSIGLSPDRRLECPTPSGVTLAMTLIRDYNLERSTTKTFNLDQVADEYYVIKRLDNVRMGEATAIQIEVGDAAAISQSPWVLHRMAFVTDKNGENIQ